MRWQVLRKVIKSSFEQSNVWENYTILRADNDIISPILYWRISLPCSHVSIPWPVENALSMCTHIVMKGFGFARMITSVPPLWSCTVQVPKYTATTRGGGGEYAGRNSSLAGHSHKQVCQAYTGCGCTGPSLAWAGWLSFLPTWSPPYIITNYSILIQIWHYIWYYPHKVYT